MLNLTLSLIIVLNISNSIIYSIYFMKDENNQKQKIEQQVMNSFKLYNNP